MSLIIDKQTCIVFDLDDTLYKEVDFLKSAYHHISKLLLPYTGQDIYDFMFGLYVNGENTFDVVKEKFSFPYSIKEIVAEYRNHKPTLTISSQTTELLQKLKTSAGKVGLLTDGRSLTQRNKIEALGIATYFDDISVSEETGYQKPAEECFTFFQTEYSDLNKFIYIADNIKKDFVTPNRLGWQTYGLKANEWNIHKQDLIIEKMYHPAHWISDLSELLS